MAGFTKLVPEIVMSSIWNEPPDVRCVWITLLATKDENGYVRGNLLSLARTANVSVEATKHAIDVFQQPDPVSNTPDNEGRRIQAVPGGWYVLNHAIYRGKDYREHEAERKREYREKHKVSRTCPGHVPDSSASASVSASVSDRERVQGKGKKSGSSCAEIPAALQAVEGFADIWPRWIESRKALKKPPTPHAQELMLKTLAEHPEHSVAAVEKCVLSGWQGFAWPWFFKDTDKARRVERNAKASGYYDSGEAEPWPDDYGAEGAKGAKG